MKETNYSEQTRDLFNTLPTNLNTLLAHWSNFCKPLKKKNRRLCVEPGLRSSSDLRVGRKLANYQLFFQSREQVVVQQEGIQRLGWVIKTLEARVCQFLLGVQVPCDRGHFRASTIQPW